MKDDYRKVICVNTNYDIELKINSQYLAQRKHLDLVNIYTIDYNFIGFFRPFQFIELNRFRNKRIDKVLKVNKAKYKLLR